MISSDSPIRGVGAFEALLVSSLLSRASLGFPKQMVTPRVHATLMLIPTITIFEPRSDN
jgi:hypothetical protein